MVELPTGIVVFLMTDVEGSSALWHEDAVGMSAAVERLSELVAAATAETGGVVLKEKGEGDSHFVVYNDASAACAAACRFQRAIHEEAWPTNVPLRVRVGIHAGEAELRERDYFGVTVNRTARIRAAANGGQVFVSRTIAELVEPTAFGRQLSAIGTFRVRDFARPQDLYLLACDGVPVDNRPPATLDLAVPPIAAVVALDVRGSASRGPSDPRSMSQQLSRFVQFTRSTFDAHDGRLLRLSDDGCVATFDSPATAVAFTNAMSVGLNAAGYRLRAGLDLGPVMTVGHEPVGPTLVYSQMLCSAARTATLRISRAAADVLRAHGIETVQSEPVERGQTRLDTFECKLDRTRAS